MTPPPLVEARQSVFLLVSSERVGYADIFYEKGTNKISRRIHGHSLKKYEKQNEDLVVVGNVKIFDEAKRKNTLINTEVPMNLQIILVY